MRKIITGLLAAFLFLGCSSQETAQVPVEPKLVVNKSLEDLKLNNQLEVPTTIDANTKKVIFAFSKETGHNCNDFFATKEASYLTSHDAQFVADVSGAPSIIRSMFILPGLKDFRHNILVLEDENIAAAYKTQENSEKIVVVYVENKIIKDIKYLDSVEELEKNLANG